MTDEKARDTEIVADVLAERQRQREKFGESKDLLDVQPGNPTGRRMGLWPGERAKRACGARASTKFLSWADILLEEVAEALDEAENGDTRALETELVQVAAVCVKWVGALRDRKASHDPDYWKERALAAEAALERLQISRPRPSSRDTDE